MISLIPLLASSPAVQCRSSSRADLQGWLAQTRHKLSGCQALAFSVQAGCCLLGRSRREQVQKEAADPSRLESGALDGGTAFVRHLYKRGINLTKCLDSTALSYCIVWYLDFGWHLGVCCIQGPRGRFSPDQYCW